MGTDTLRDAVIKRLNDKVLEQAPNPSNFYSNIFTKRKPKTESFAWSTFMGVLEGNRVSEQTFILAAKYIGFSAKEIREMCKDLGYTGLWPLIGTNDMGLVAQTIGHAVEAILAQHPEAAEGLVGQITLVGNAYGIDVSEFLKGILSSNKKGKK